MLPDQIALALFIFMLLVLYLIESYYRMHLRWYWGVAAVVVLAVVWHYLGNWWGTMSLTAPRRRRHLMTTAPSSEEGYSYEY